MSFRPAQDANIVAGQSSNKMTKQVVSNENVSSPSNVENTPITITRRINVKIQGSMSDFAQDGQGTATWRAVDGKQAVIWGLQDLALNSSATTVNSSSSTHNSATHALGNAVIQQAVLLEHKSDFQVLLLFSSSIYALILF